LYGETRGFHTEKLREEYVKYRREGGGGEESRLVKEDQRSASPYRKSEAWEWKTHPQPPYERKDIISTSTPP
jgi:hypothetical protein